MNFPQQAIRALCQAVKHLLRRWTKPNNDALVLHAALDLTRSRTELVLENALLRQQLIVLKRQVKRPALTWRDQALFVLLASWLRTWKQTLLIVQPDTLLRWHRELFLSRDVCVRHDRAQVTARRTLWCDQKPHRCLGRPATAQCNSSWRRTALSHPRQRPQIRFFLRASGQGDRDRGAADTSSSPQGECHL